MHDLFSVLHSPFSDSDGWGALLHNLPGLVGVHASRKLWRKVIVSGIIIEIGVLLTRLSIITLLNIG